jgi:toxin ParE1/3/4
MNNKVYIIADAEDDLLEIAHYVMINDSEEKAEALLKKIEETCLSLKKYPNRGHAPPELARIGIYSFQEIHYKPYRIIYQVIKSEVYIHCVLDGRRSLQELLEKRLLK